jgi:hypothetical protein
MHRWLLMAVIIFGAKFPIEVSYLEKFEVITPRISLNSLEPNFSFKLLEFHLVPLYQLSQTKIEHCHT